MENIYERSIREFLNPPGSTEPSVIVASFTIDRGVRERPYSEGRIVISDCSKQIYLDIDFQDEKAYEKSKYKLDVLQKIIEQAKLELEIAKKVHEDEVAAYEAKKKESEDKESEDKKDDLNNTLQEFIDNL